MPKCVVSAEGGMLMSNEFREYVRTQNRWSADISAGSGGRNMAMEVLKKIDGNI